MMINLLESCIQHLEIDYKRIHVKVYAFMLNLCSLMVKSELLLEEIQEKQMIDRYF